MISSNKPASPDKKAALQTTIERLGKDEMNLVEHPFALLKRSAAGKVIYLEWDKVHPRNGKILKASWRVDCDSELGLPGPVEERLYLVLMELSREQSWPDRVMFSRHDLLQRLGLKKSATNYNMLREAFLRLRGVQIEARNSFWLPHTQTFAASTMFSLINEVVIVDEEAGKRKGQIPLMLSWFEWSRVMRESFANSNIRTLNVEFAVSLELPLSMRLFRYLDKHRTTGESGTRSKYEIELHRMCEIHLGMTSSPYASKLKERLLPAHKELIERGFIAEVVYEPMKTQSGAEKVVYYFTNGPLPVSRLNTELEVENVSTENVSVETPSLSTVMFGAAADAGAIPSRVELMLSLDWKDEAKVTDACDVVFEALSEVEKNRILDRSKAEMPEILRNNLSSEGARNTLNRKRRDTVKSEYRGAVETVLRSNIAKELDE